MERSLEETVIELRRIFKEELSRPFPYDDCRHVRAQDGEIGELLIPHLVLYFMDIAGYCSHGKKLLLLSEDNLRKAQATLAKSFFEKHPEYFALINGTNTPTLFAELGLYDKVRLQLLAVIAELLSTPEASEPLLANALGGATPGQSVMHYPSQNRVSE